MGLITPVYYLTGKRATANEHLQGALKMKGSWVLMMAVRVILLSLGDTDSTLAAPRKWLF